jgi:hypothetical protein
MTTLKTKQEEELSLKDKVINKLFNNNIETTFEEKTTSIFTIRKDLKTIFKKEKELLASIEQTTTFLNNKQQENTIITIYERIFCIMNDINHMTKCEYCKKNDTTFLKYSYGYHKCCSKECCEKGNLLKREKTNLEKYGNKCTLRNEKINEKTIATNIKKFGTSCPFGNKEIQQKSKDTLLKNYNVDNISKSEIIKEKKKQTALKNYGVEYGSQSPIIKEKMKNTCLTKYGVDSPTKTKEVQEKMKNTCLKKYGVDNPAKNEQIKEKMINTCLIRYGVNNPMKNEIIKEKLKQSNLKTNQSRYGVDTTFKRKDIQEKFKKTWLKKYGVDNPSKNEIIKNKIKNTNLTTNQSRYGVDTTFDRKEIKEKIINNNILRHGNAFTTQRNLKNIKFFTKEYLENNFLNNQNKLKKTEIIKHFNFSEGTFYRYLRENIELNYFNVKRENVSKQEIVISEYILSLNNNLKIIHNSKTIITNNKKSYELDLYIPELNIAIEYNGMMYHSFGINKHSIFNNLKIIETKKEHHLMKTNVCENKGIQLFHINENEWLNPVKQNIWKNILENTIIFKESYNNKPTLDLDFEIKIIDNHSTKNNKIIYNFLENNHLEGYSSSNLKIGLYIKNTQELISILLFETPQTIKNTKNKTLNQQYISTQPTYLLKRICTKLEYSKYNNFLIEQLFNFFKENILQQNEKIHIYLNRRYNIFNKENILSKIGFKENYIIQKNNKNNINCFIFSIKNINKLSHFNFCDFETTKEYLLNNNLDKRIIFDSGNVFLEYLKKFIK